MNGSALFHRVVVAACAAVALAGCGGTEPGQLAGAASGCEGARLDAADRCRLPNGHFASQACCALPATPDERRSLEAYHCPAAGALIAVAFFDADSTLRVSKSGSPTANGEKDVNVLPFAARRIAELNQQARLVAIVSNQGGVAEGQITVAAAQAALAFTASQLARLGGKIDYFDFAEKNDEFRKPKTGMAKHLDQLLGETCGASVDWPATFMVGDAGYKKGVDGPHPDGRPADDFSNSDRLFAENLGIPFHEPTDYFGWRDCGTFNIHDEGDLLALLVAMEQEIAALEQSGADPERLAVLEQEVASIREVNGL
ncbi:MAG: HAD-IIIA family hydrolase [Deltaproteobacteria bacterium]|nr:HAD-IIIA family hydrolase [Deltaproteobacteria bacterium]